MLCDLTLYQYSWSNHEYKKESSHNFFLQGKIKGIYFSNYGKFEEKDDDEWCVDDFDNYTLFYCLENNYFYSLTFLHAPIKLLNTNNDYEPINNCFENIYKLYCRFISMDLFFTAQYYLKTHYIYNEKNIETEKNIIVFKNVKFFSEELLEKNIKNLYNDNNINRIYNMEDE